MIIYLYTHIYTYVISDTCVYTWVYIYIYIYIYNYRQNCFDLLGLISVVLMSRMEYICGIWDFCIVFDSGHRTQFDYAFLNLNCSFALYRWQSSDTAVTLQRYKYLFISSNFILLPCIFWIYYLLNFHPVCLGCLQSITSGTRQSQFQSHIQQALPWQIWESI